MDGLGEELWNEVGDVLLWPEGGLLRYFLKAPDPFYDVKTPRFKNTPE